MKKQRRPTECATGEVGSIDQRLDQFLFLRSVFELLAEAGLTAPQDILENPRGWFHVFSQGKANWTALLTGLGEHWELRMTGLKAFSNGIVVQPLEEAVIALRNDYGLTPAEVESIHGTGNERIAQEMGRYPVPRKSLHNILIQACRYP